MPTAADLEKVLQAVGSGAVPPGVLYVQFETDFGSAAFDPFAAAQDPATQAVVRAVGIRNITVGFGPVPELQPGTPSLVENLKTFGLVALGAAALYFRPPLWVLGAGALGYLALTRGGALFQGAA